MLKKTLFTLIAVSMIVYASGITKAQDQIEVDVTEAAVSTNMNNGNQCNSCTNSPVYMQQDCAGNIPCPQPCEPVCVPPC
ncbi:MAG: hypothetical protein Q4C95_03735 [Planctomycetia bacterium]|nr:hypothetical protein [Planctomycetia bacterium]